MSPSDFARVLRAAAEEAERIATEHRATRAEWSDQTASPLGRRRHCAAVRRRVARGEPGAAIVGRRHLLSADALAAELARASTTPRDREPSAGDEIERALRLVRGAR